MPCVFLSFPPYDAGHRRFPAPRKAGGLTPVDPRELSTEEGFCLIDQVRAFGVKMPLFVLTGGNPMRRPHLADLVGYAAAQGLRVALTPSGTAAAIEHLKILELPSSRRT